MEDAGRHKKTEDTKRLQQVIRISGEKNILAVISGWASGFLMEEVWSKWSRTKEKSDSNLTKKKQEEEILRRKNKKNQFKEERTNLEKKNIEEERTKKANLKKKKQSWRWKNKKKKFEQEQI